MGRSLDDIASLGFTSISYDIQYSWMNRDRTAWDKVVRASLERELKTVPVVSYGYLPGAASLSTLTGQRVTTAVNCRGQATDSIDTHDLGNVEPYVSYLKGLIADYGDALLEIRGRTLLNFWEPSMVDWGRKERLHLGYGTEVVDDFSEWALRRGDLKDLNERWNTNFSSDNEIHPPTTGLWDDNSPIIFIKPDLFWDDWCLFRAEVLAAFYRELFARLKREADVEIALGLSQHGVVTQHDAYHQRCIHLPLWEDVAADRFIVSDDLYCKSASEVLTCMEAEMLLFSRHFGRRITAFVTPVEGRVLVGSPRRFYQLCSDFDLEYLYLYAWNEMGDGANIRDHREIWPELEELLREYEE
jgi:hypothetical protein